MYTVELMPTKRKKRQNAKQQTRRVVTDALVVRRAKFFYQSKIGSHPIFGSTNKRTRRQPNTNKICRQGFFLTTNITAYLFRTHKTQTIKRQTCTTSEAISNHDRQASIRHRTIDKVYRNCDLKTK
jgi:hypothetical protein